MSNEHDICIACGKEAEDGQNECTECMKEMARQYMAYLNGDDNNAWGDIARATGARLCHSCGDRWPNTEDYFGLNSGGVCGACYLEGERNT